MLVSACYYILLSKDTPILSWIAGPPNLYARHLFDTWEKNRGPEFDTFSPGTEYHFANARNSFFLFIDTRHPVSLQTPDLQTTLILIYLSLFIDTRHPVSLQTPDLQTTLILVYLSLFIDTRHPVSLQTPDLQTTLILVYLSLFIDT
jgi:hypothetical protein